MLLSTHDLAVAEEVEDGQSVRIGARRRGEAGKMMCKYAGIEEEEVLLRNDSVVKQSHQYILKRCGGLPVALGVARV